MLTFSEQNNNKLTQTYVTVIVKSKKCINMADERSDLAHKSALTLSCCGLTVSSVVSYGLFLGGSFLVFLKIVLPMAG